MNLGKNTIYNLAGSMIPLVLALATVPAYLELVGVERYGALAIVWLILGYFGLFDMGLGRAATHRVAVLKNGSAQEHGDVFWTAMTVNVVMGVIGGFILYSAAGYFFANHLRVSEALRSELLQSLPILALAVPVATATGVASGTLQGREMFLEVNLNTVAGTTLFQLLPLWVAWQIGPSLSGLILAAVIARCVGLTLFFIRVKQRVLRDSRPRFDRRQWAALFKYGGWVTVTMAVSPLLVVADRFLIGATITAAAVTVYTIPFDIVQRVSLLPRSICMALFPKMAASDDETSRNLSIRLTRIMTTLITPPVLFLMFVMHPFLKIWVSEELAAKSAPIGLVLLLGYWINAFAIIPYSRLQASGRPDIVSIALVAQVPFYFFAVYLALATFGLMGAAVVFTIRTFADYFILSYFSYRVVLFPREMLAALMLLLGATSVILVTSALSIGWWAAFCLSSLALLVFLARNIPAELQGLVQRLIPPSLLRIVLFK